jgi:hypothetical protein
MGGTEEMKRYAIDDGELCEFSEGPLVLYWEIQSELLKRDKEIKKLTKINRESCCAFCGIRLAEDAAWLGEARTNALADHIKTCEKHPMRKLEQELKELKLMVNTKETNSIPFIEDGCRYYIVLYGKNKTYISKAQWVAYERMAGFYPEGKDYGQPATETWTNGHTSGGIEHIR